VNIRIALGTGLLLTVGTAVAGSLFYGEGRSGANTTASPAATISAPHAVTPEMVASWQATAGSDDYFAPKVPI
jgi:hypothetical protein